MNNPSVARVRRVFSAVFSFVLWGMLVVGDPLPTEPPCDPPTLNVPSCVVSGDDLVGDSVGEYEMTVTATDDRPHTYGVDTSNVGPIGGVYTNSFSFSTVGAVVGTYITVTASYSNGKTASADVLVK